MKNNIRNLCVLMLLIMPIVPSAHAQTPAREQLKRLLAAVNSGDRPTLEQYAKASLSPNYKDSLSVDDALTMHKFTGGSRCPRTYRCRAKPGERMGTHA